MNKLSKEKRDKLLLVALGTGGLLAALYLLIISSQQAALREYTARIEATQEKLAKAERWARMAPGIKTKLEASQKELDAKQEDMAPVDKFKWFYNTLENFLARHQVSLRDITREPELGEVGVLPRFPYQAATFGVKLSARYHEFGRFLAEFENQFPYMRVQNLELEPEGAARLGTKEALPTERHAAGHPENLAITLRIVTLVKPGTPI